MAVIASGDVSAAATPTSPSANFVRPCIAALLALIVWVLLLGWSAFRLAVSWPYVGLMPQWVVLLAIPGTLFRSLDLVWLHLRKRRIAGWRRAGARVLALVLGVPCAVMAWEVLDARSMRSFEGAMAPLVARLHAAPPKTCPTGTEARLGAGLVAYLDASAAPTVMAELHVDARRFILALPGRSMDIDGSTMFYDATTRRWRKVHNDTLQRTGELAALTQGLSSCRFPLR